MGELSDTLDEFQEASEKYYQRIMEILEDKYCWKCPMRTNRDETLCREVEAWIKLTEAMESGVRERLSEDNRSREDIEVITAKFLEKIMKLEKKMKSPENMKTTYNKVGRRRRTLCRIWRFYFRANLPIKG